METAFWLAWFGWLLLFLPMTLCVLVGLGRLFRLVATIPPLARGDRGARRAAGATLRQLGRGSLLVASMAVLWYDLGRFLARHAAFWD